MPVAARALMAVNAIFIVFWVMISVFNVLIFFPVNLPLALVAAVAFVGMIASNVVQLRAIWRNNHGR